MMWNPRTIHDFYGLPPERYKQEYPASDSPELAREAGKVLPRAETDYEWGLDHGAWVALKRIFPKADVPVVQLSLVRKSAEVRFSIFPTVPFRRR
jgi:4,5-DOPA dioxygenase extradiol